MEFISGLALVLLALVGYSSGAVIGARGRTPVPGILDLVVVVCIWIVALTTRYLLGKWLAIAIWLVAGLVIAALLAVARLKQYAKTKSSGRAKGSGQGPLAKVWESWKGFSRRMGNYQSRVLMALLYFTVVLPFGLGVTLLGDPLKIKHSGSWSDVTLTNWRPKHAPITPSLEEAGRQF
jgi:hypothetical protein